MDPPDVKTWKIFGGLMKSLIKKLVETTGPSGYEGQIRALIRSEVEKFADEIRVDPMGNLLVRKGAKGKGGARVMLSAHMDEIGVIATHIDENGFVRFAAIGGVYPAFCIGGRVRFTTGSAGLIGVEKEFMRDKTPALDNLYIDLGATSRETCPVKVGDIGAFERPYIEMGDRLVSKAMDDRIGVAVLIETLRTFETSPHEVYFVFSTQEEVGTRGAMTSAYGIDPEIGIAVDVTLTGDTPRGSKMEVSLGKGPAIKVRDSGMLSDPRLVRKMVETAEKDSIPYQMEVLEGGTTDARAIQSTRSGVPAGCISVPCRYVHSPSEMVDYNDVINSVRLLRALLAGPLLDGNPVQ
jgi:putative aminopeptidase FrvX